MLSIQTGNLQTRSTLRGMSVVKHSLEVVIGLEIFNTAILSRVIKFHLIANDLKIMLVMSAQAMVYLISIG